MSFADRLKAVTEKGKEPTLKSMEEFTKDKAESNEGSIEGSSDVGTASSENGTEQQTSETKGNTDSFAAAFVVEKSSYPEVTDSEQEKSKLVNDPPSSEESGMVVYSKDLATKSVSLRNTPKLESSLFTEFVGLKGEGRDISLYTPAKTDSVPLKPVPVKDTDGRISNIISAFSEKIGFRIIPESMTKIPRWVAPRDHYEFISGEERYFVSKKDSEETVQKVIEEALEVLSNGRVYTKGISHEVVYEGKSFVSYSLSPSEVSEICTQLQAYSPKAMDSQEGVDRLVLVIGDYIYE